MYLLIISALNTLMSAGLDRSMLLSEVHIGTYGFRQQASKPVCSRVRHRTSSVGVTFSTKVCIQLPAALTFLWYDHGLAFTTQTLNETKTCLSLSSAVMRNRYINEHSINGLQLWWTFLQSACQLHAPSKLATSVALCCVIKLHILEWPFIVASLRHTCEIIMLSNQHLYMPHLWGGWIISTKEKCSLTQI